MRMLFEATFGVYLLVLIAIGVYFFFTEETKLPSDYLVAGRNVGPWPMAFSQIASMASGWTFFAWVSIGFLLGFFGLFWAVVHLTLTLLLYRFVAPKFRRDSEEYDSITMVDHMARHFERINSPWAGPIRLLGAAIILVFLVAYIGAQIIAVGDSAVIGLEMDYTVAIIVGGIAVAIYTGLGGFNASVWTDFLQGILMVFLAFALPVMIIYQIGGWGEFTATAATEYPELLGLSGGLTGMDFWVELLVFVTFAMALIGQPHSIVRFQAIESEKVLSKASVIALFVSATRMTLPLFIGISARVLYETPEALPDANPENAAMFAIVDLFPAILAGILMAGVVSAILSTADSMMLLVTSEALRLYERYVNPDASRQARVLLSRALVLVLAGWGIVVAYYRPGTLFEIILFAFVGLGAPLGLGLLFVLFWEQSTGAGVFAGLATGLVVTIVNQLYWPDYFPIFVWPVTFAAFVLVSLLTTEEQAQPAGTPADD